MKFLKNKYTALFYAFLICLGFSISSCESDNEVVPKTLEQYKIELSDIVSSEKETVSSCVMGYDKGNFKIDTLLFIEVSTEYLNVLSDADSILNIEGLTIADVMEANFLISKPGNVFNNNIWISDRRPLQEAIVYCDTLRVHTFEGTQPGMVPKEARDRFGAAISEAKSIRGASTTIQRQVTEATEELNMELEIFKEAIIK